MNVGDGIRIAEMMKRQNGVRDRRRIERLLYVGRTECGGVVPSRAGE